MQGEVKDKDRKLGEISEELREVTEAKGVADECINLKKDEITSWEIKLK